MVFLELVLREVLACLNDFSGINNHIDLQLTVDTVSLSTDNTRNYITMAKPDAAATTLNAC